MFSIYYPTKIVVTVHINTLRPDKIAASLADDIFNCISLNEIMNFKYNFIEICSLGSNEQYGCIHSDNGLVPNKWQVLVLSIVGMLYWHIYMPLGLNELIFVISVQILSHCDNKFLKNWPTTRSRLMKYQYHYKQPFLLISILGKYYLCIWLT